MIAVFHQLVYTSVGLCLGLSLPDVDANEVVFKAEMLHDVSYIHNLRIPEMRRTDLLSMIRQDIVLPVRISAWLNGHRREARLTVY